MARPQQGVLPPNPTTLAFDDTPSPGAAGDGPALASHRHGMPGGLSTGHIYRAYRTSSQNIASATVTPVVWNANSVLNDSGYFDRPSNTEIRVLKGGCWWRVYFHGQFEPNGTGRRELRVYVNGAYLFDASSGALTSNTWSGTGVYLLPTANNSPFEMNVLQNSGGALQLTYAMMTVELAYEP